MDNSDNKKAEKKIISGMYREYNSLSIFWPCGWMGPHFVKFKGSAKYEIQRLIKGTGGLYITVEAVLTDEKTRGQDGTAIIYRGISKDNDIGC